MSARSDSIEKLNRAVDGYDDDHAELIDIRIGADGTTYASAGDAVRGQVGELKNALNTVVSDYANLAPYFYKANIYINLNGAETALTGYDTYKIPVNVGDIIRFSWPSLSEVPWGAGFSNGYAFHVHKTDDTYLNMSTTVGNVGRIWVANKEAIIVASTDADYVTITILHENVGAVTIEKNHPSPNLIDDEKVSIYDTVFNVNEQTAIKTQFYVDANGNYQVMGNTISVFPVRLNSGDMAIFQEMPTGTSYRGTFRANDGTAQKIGTIIASPYTFKAEADGVLFVFASAAGAKETVIEPAAQIMISAKNVYGLTEGTQFDGLSGVAFGTSLTYNASIGNGYLTRLGILSGISFDNQGVGSSTILGNGGSLDMLAKIKTYTSFSDKRICLLEGFVNDWYGQNPLGTWRDTEETTVCGCVRSALTYMLTQNANMTVFLILDHYGKQYNTVDCSSTVKKNNLTQYEYYSEIAKVAESLGIPVIREFELSGISELMPQYLADNIHLNALGAIQSANVIWNEMKLHPLNAN